MILSRSLSGILFPVFALTSLVLTALGVRGTEAGVTLLLAGLVILLGLPHGAADPWVAKEAKLWRTPKGLAVFLVVYLALVIISAGFWRILPFIALCFFLIISWIHFSGDWRSGLPAPLRLCLSGCVICGPTLLYSDQVLSVFQSITFGAAEASFLVSGLRLAAPLFLAGGVGSALLVFSSVSIRTELLLLVTTSVLVPPLLFFITYFCGLHSPRHLQHTFGQLRPHTPIARIGVVTLLTTALALMALPFLPDTLNAMAGIQTLVFGGLFALTVPHMLLVEWREQSRPPGASEPFFFHFHRGKAPLNP